jgi:hypothetical protein
VRLFPEGDLSSHYSGLWATRSRCGYDGYTGMCWLAAASLTTPQDADPWHGDVESSLVVDRPIDRLASL